MYPSEYNTATPHIHPLSLHDALPILDEIDLSAAAQLPERRLAKRRAVPLGHERLDGEPLLRRRRDQREDRKSTRLNSSHPSISYAVFCFNKKKVALCVCKTCVEESGV